MRTIILLVLNLALPFLLRALWLLWLDWRAKKSGKDSKVIDVTPQKRFPILPLLGAGVLLLGLSLLVVRFTAGNGDAEPWQAANPAATIDY